MGNWVTLLSDICVIIFDLLLYIRLTTLRRNEARSRNILYMGCAVIVVFYILAVTVFLWPVSISTFVCMTIPSLVLFWILSKYRDARFFLTFCFVDTVSLIIGYIARYIWVMLGNAGGVAAIAIMLLSFALIYRNGKPYFEKYRAALELIDRGWIQLTCSAAFIYITLIFCAAYPKPLIERPEYFLSYLVISVMVLSFYVIFITNIIVTRKVYEQSMQLKEQQKWFKMAYVDALTDLPNRMAYMEKIYALERMNDKTSPVAVIVMDMDHFKDINDTFGHSVGDEVLKRAAKYMSDCLSGNNATVYRIGGDEFAAITVGINQDDILLILEKLERSQSGNLAYSISSGYSFIDRSEKNAVDQAFSRADAMMYANKARKQLSS